MAFGIKNQKIKNRKSGSNVAISQDLITNGLKYIRTAYNLSVA